MVQTISGGQADFEKGDFIRLGKSYYRSSWYCVLKDDPDTLTVRTITWLEYLKALPRIIYADIKNLLKSLKTTIVSNH